MQRYVSLDRAVFGPSPEFWLNAQMAVDLHAARKKIAGELDEMRIRAKA